MDIDDVIKFFGGTQEKAAAALGVAQPTIATWKKEGIPILRQYQIQHASQGRLKATEKERAA